MAVTKAQLVVWALIAGLSAGGYALLSKVRLPETVPAAPVAAVLTEAPTAAKAPVVKPVAVPANLAPVAVAATLPDTIPEFPFPDNLVPATVAAPQPTTGTVAAFSGSTGEATPQIVILSGSEKPPTIEALSPETAPVVATAIEPATPAAEPEAQTLVAEEPPIPMPSRPLAARPVKATPLAEVKTFYVVADALNVRAMPSTSGTVLQKVPQGFAVAAREQSNEWVGFLMRDGSTGWLRTDYLSDTMPPPAPSAGAVSSGPLNLMM
jgi:uncharacterized protein YgiM (DUF1202 family)